MKSRTKTQRFLILRLMGLALVISTISLIGCGGNKAHISGKVTTNGKAVTGGTLTFSPAAAASNPGKPVSVTIQTDGTYSLSEGAPVGTLKVSYAAPILDYPAGHEPKPEEPLPKSPFAGLAPRQETIEATSGSQTIDIDLVRK
jgi:hypothetical protein